MDKLNRNIKLENSTFLFATCSMWFKGKRMPTNGNVEPLRDFLHPIVKKLVIIDQPVPGSESVMPRIEIYEKQFEKPKLGTSSWWLYLLYPLLRLGNRHGTRVIFKIRDFFSVLDWPFRYKTKFDYLIGLESINCIAGILLKKLGRVNKVIYYVLDYAPNRFSNKLFNCVYLFLDRYCSQNADFIWDVSKAFHPARIERGLDPGRSAPVIHVPIGLYPYQIIKRVKKKIRRNLVYVGTLGEENGPDLAIRALKIVLDKYKNAKLHIIGGGDKNIDRLKELAKKLNVLNHVLFYGYIPSTKEMVQIISKFDVALAPYKEIEGSIRYYADSSKIRTYAGVGLPVVTTNIPPLGRELAKLGGALIVKDNEIDIANAVIMLFENKRIYENMSRKVMSFSRNNTWDNEFSKAFKEMAIYL